MVKINLLQEQKRNYPFNNSSIKFEKLLLPIVGLFFGGLLLFKIFFLTKENANHLTNQPVQKTQQEIQTEAIIDLTNQIKELNQRLQNLENKDR